MTKSVHSLRVVCLFAALTVFMGVVAFDAPARSADAQSGYLLGTDAGRIFAFGDFEQRQLVSAEPIVDFTSLSDGSGVVAIDASGHLISAGAVSVPAGVDNSAWAIDEWAVGIVAVPGREGFWAITSAGRVQVVGDAPAIADVSSLDLASPVVAGSATPDGRGLYLIGADGGIFALGTARFLGSVPEVLPGVRLDAPIVGLAPTPSGRGYWLVASDGGLFSFGDAAFRGSIPQILPGVTLNKPVVGAVGYGSGYLMVASDGGIFNFSELEFLGSLGGDPPADPVVAVVPVVKSGTTSTSSTTAATTTTTTASSTTTTSTSSSTSTTTTTTTVPATTTTTSVTTTTVPATTTTTTTTTTTAPTTTTTTVAAGSDATITIWHDTTPDFAFVGVPQRWANVMGEVSDPDGIALVQYRLNSGPWTEMQIGPDVRRLAGQGHFNIDLLLDDMNSGSNTVVIKVTDADGGVTTKNVTVRKGSGPNWPLPVSVDWSSSGNITNLAQPVDGEWRVVGGKLNNVDDGYDRIIAIGDTDWTDYQVQVTVRYNSIHPNAYSWPSNGPGVGFALRWNGHNDTVMPGSQPLLGFRPDGINPTPFGGIFFWRDRNDAAAAIELYDHDNVVRDRDTSATMAPGETWVFKAQVFGSGNVTYRLKAWPQGQAEPSSWNLQYTISGDSDAASGGSLALIAHEVDATFGDVVVTPL